MKTRNILILCAAALGLASCDMDKYPYDSIPDEEALQTPTDFENIREGLYTGMRSVVGGDYGLQSAMCDEFNNVSGTNASEAYTWTWTNNYSSAESLYANYQALIGRANFIIDGYNKCNFSNTVLFTPTVMTSVRSTKGDAFFVRAYSLFYLAQYFCADYEASTADNAHSGVSYQLHYNPSSDKSTYPGRNTLNETAQQIKADLDSAAVYISAKGEPASARFTQDAITALRARLALWMDDYANAANYAASLVDGGNYALTETDADIEDMWQQDGGDESIVQFPIAANTEMASQLGMMYLPYSTGSNPQFVPTQSLYDLYSDDDFRKTAYFTDGNVVTTSGVSADVKFFNKYIDHTRVWEQVSSQSEGGRFVIEPRLFRIAEMYLIAAEGYAQSGDLSKANKYLGDLEYMRILTDYTNYTTVNQFMAELRKERQREMAGEGTRLFDLKRWHLGVTRGTPQVLSICANPGSTITTALVKGADDPRFILPIPKSEMDANPNLRGQQNPGY